MRPFKQGTALHEFVPQGASELQQIIFNSTKKRPIYFIKLTLIKALIVAGAEGAAAPINFEHEVLSPFDFQPF